MSTALRDRVVAALAAFSSRSRLYALRVGDEDDDGTLLVEAFAAEDALDAIGTRDVIVLATSTHLDLEGLLGQPVALAVSLADGSHTRFAGEICAADMLGSDGALTRYRLRISPWLWRLSQVRNNRVWQDKSVREIVDDVFRAYQPGARWRWSAELSSCMERVPPRSYCCQYRESDLDFVRRLLAEEGLCWRVEQTEDGHGAVLFADSTRVAAVPEDPVSAREGGIRYHGARAVERQDTVQALIAERRLHATLTTLLSTNYKGKQAVAASSPSLTRFAGKLPPLESYDAPGQYAFANYEQARRQADLRMEALEARGQRWQGRSTLRSLCAGTRVKITGVPLKALGNAPAFTVLRVLSVGVNNMPVPAQQALAELFGPASELLLEEARHASPELLAQARETGYANAFDAVPAGVVWRPQMPDKPTARGSQTAVVIGADGSDRPNGADEIYCDRLGRVRIRFHWQDNTATCWVRVAQRAAGGGMGSQFLPRIGQEVLVQFLENDIDRPIIVGALYNGRGEGGIPATPGGRIQTQSNPAVFEPAHDHMRSGQANLSGGNSPVWHGASSSGDGHRNPAAQWGIRSKEFGGWGYNQLLFDDTDGRGRVQLRCTHAASSLDLGHLIHSADNYRGSFRGLGAELRTDAYGAVRAGKSLLVSSYGIAHSASARDPAGENAAGVGMMAQVAKLAAAFHAAAVAHQTVGLAAHQGAVRANGSVLDGEAAPLAALAASLAGMADRQGATVVGTAGGEASGDFTVPYPADPLIAIAAKDGLGVSAGQSLQLVNGETISLTSGHDTQFVTGGQLRWHTGQALGVLGGAVKAGAGGLGVQLIAGKGAVDLQAQSDELKVQARDEVNVISAHAHIDWAAAKWISLSTAGGANIRIEGGNITVQCPGKITVHAGTKSLKSQDRTNYKLPAFPQSVCVECLSKRALQRSAFIKKGP